MFQYFYSANGSGLGTTIPAWTEAYTYDGFGNLLDKTSTGGAPTLQQAVNANSNQIVGQGYDANGNATNYGSYDYENRLAGSGGDAFSYGPDNLRTYKNQSNGTEYVYFYDPYGHRMGAYEISSPAWAQDNVYCVCWEATASWFGGMNLAGTDRLGSAESGYGYFPYGEEYTPSSSDGDNFATYYHDVDTGLDYSRNRYYNSILGRFLSADPTNGGADLADPGSLNKYVYVGADPVNRNDPTGLFDDGDTQCLDPIYAASHAQCQGPGSPYCMAHPGDESCNGDGNDGGCLNGDPGTPFAPGGGPGPTPCNGGGGGGPAGPTGPPPLTCSFLGPQFDPVNSEPDYAKGHVLGWWAASAFAFQASGGTGDYSWLESQYYNWTETYNHGKTVRKHGQDETLDNEPVGNDGIIYYDSPGLTFKGLIGTHGPSNYLITLDLSVTLTSGTQVVSCGAIPWFANVTVTNGIGSGTGKLGFPLSGFTFP